MSRVPIIDLDKETSAETIELARSLGYFYIPRSSRYGSIPDQCSLKTFLDQLFHSSSEEKLAFGCDYLRSMNLTDEPFEKESLTFTSTSDLRRLPKSTFLQDFFQTAQTIVEHLRQCFPTDKHSSLNEDILQLNHYKQTDAKSLIIHSLDETLCQLHFYSSYHFEYLHSFEQQWKSIPSLVNSSEYLLVTLPHLIYRYSSDDLCFNLSNYTINYSFPLQRTAAKKRTYFFSLNENTILRYFTFFYLYAMQGVPAGFSTTALANYLTAEGEQSSTVGTFVSLSGLPWGLQFVWGPLIDRFQSSAMGRRRPWVIFSQICAFLASLGLLFVGHPPTSYIKELVIAFFIHSIFASIQDASVDAQAITTITIEERGRINGFMRGGFLIGSAIGSAGLSWILRNRGYRQAALINSSFLFLFTLITFFIKEKSDDHLFPFQKKKSTRLDYRRNENYSIFKLFKELFKGLFAKQSLRLYLPVLVAYTSQSIFIRAYNIHLIKVLSWSDTSVSILSGAWGTLIVVVVVLIGGYLADRVGARRLLLLVLLIHTIYMFTVNLLEPFWHHRPVATTILIAWSMMDPILSAASMPVLMSLCRKHVEGSQFTTYMSFVNLCDLFGAFLSGQLQRVLKANVIGLGCAVCLLLALLTVILALYLEKKHRRIIEETDEHGNDKSKAFPRLCWPFHLIGKHHRRSFKITVQT